ncbi:MAG: glycosyltransferase family 2 protein [Bacteroidaceae bacterium]|nr:glycosyltransferase family 2 protein [Bacteroidaceae bacterium]
MIRLAIVSPCYNEEAVLHESASRLSALFDDLIAKRKISDDSFVLYVNDGSRDQTWPIIQRLHESNRFICGLNLTHNVGHQNAIMAGMMTARHHADAVVTIDADLQDDIMAIEQMVDKHEAGSDIVYGVKISREGDSFIKRSTALLFYRIQSSMGVKAVYNHADFRLLSKRALDELSLYRERNLYLRGLMPMMGFPSDTVDDVISPRFAGSSKYTLSKMLRLATDGITSFSTKPITLIIGLGAVGMCFSLLMLVYVLVSWISGHVVPGWSSIMLSVWFIGSALILSIGVVGEYIGKIYIEVKQRPLYTVEEVLGLPQESA